MEFPNCGIILCAGLGTRMGDLCKDIPKPLLKVENKTLIEWQIEIFKTLDIKIIGVNVHYQKNLMLEEVERLKKKFPSMAFYSSIEEPEILGQGGGLRNLSEILPSENYLVCNCDAFSSPKKINYDPQNIYLYVTKEDGVSYNRIFFEKNSYHIKEKSKDPNGYLYTGYMLISKNHIEHLPLDTFNDVKEKIWAKYPNALKPIEVPSWLDLGEKDLFLRNAPKLKTLLT